ncbi:sugar-binding domain-containing protein [Leifsonia sp. L25]|uniref:sugar-binding domain-containing protein n=1 Tax=Actinomycetes TaxID=1760 RepID=UPI003D68D4D5
MKTSFNADWIVRPNVSIFTQLNADADESETITLPHDAMLDLPRDPSIGPSTGYFSGGSVAYTKQFDVPDEWRDKRVSVEFQGVYRDATVFVNGAYLGQRPSGHSPFRIALDPALRYGETNEIRVEARAHEDARWYSGLGIYRDTVLTVSGLLHLKADGIQVTTPDVDDERAVVEVSTTLLNEGVNTRTVRVAIDIVDAEGQTVASGSSPVTLAPGETATAHQRLYVSTPRLWELDSPTSTPRRSRSRTATKLSTKTPCDSAYGRSDWIRRTGCASTARPSSSVAPACTMTTGFSALSRSTAQKSVESSCSKRPVSTRSGLRTPPQSCGAGRLRPAGDAGRR